MKNRNLSVVGVCMLACAVLILAPLLLRNGGQALHNWASLSTKSNFYFRKGQWKADLRTLAACFRYLHFSRTASLTNAMKVAAAPSTQPLQFDFATHPLELDETGSSLQLVGNRLLSRAERLNGYNRLSSVHGLPPMFASADSRQCVLDGASVSSASVMRHVPQGLLQHTNLAPPKMRHPRIGPAATNLQGV